MRHRVEADRGNEREPAQAAAVPHGLGILAEGVAGAKKGDNALKEKKKKIYNNNNNR